VLANEVQGSVEKKENKKPIFNKKSSVSSKNLIDEDYSIVRRKIEQQKKINQKNVW